jgi:hypothetical protein
MLVSHVSMLRRFAEGDGRGRAGVAGRREGEAVKFQRLRIITGIVAFAGSGGAIGTVAAVYLGHGFYSIDLIVFSIGLGAIPAAIAGLTMGRLAGHVRSDSAIFAWLVFAHLVGLAIGTLAGFYLVAAIFSRVARL